MTNLDEQIAAVRLAKDWIDGDSSIDLDSISIPALRAVLAKLEAEKAAAPQTDEQDAERGRPLTETEKVRNLFRAIYSDELEAAEARGRASAAATDADAMKGKASPEARQIIEIIQREADSGAPIQRVLEYAAELIDFWRSKDGRAGGAADRKGLERAEAIASEVADERYLEPGAYSAANTIRHRIRAALKEQI